MIEVIGIGSELLNGSTVNTNASFISALLYKEGFFVSHHSVVGDSPEDLKITLEKAFEYHQVVITTGGLGPTCDDLTRQVIAEYVESDFYYNKEVASHLIARYGSELESLKDQATVPVKAKVMLNNVGTASGLIFQQEDKFSKKKQHLIVLPGVPLEMEQMMLDSVFPYLKGQFFKEETNIIEGFHFLQLKESSVDPLLREFREKYPKVSIGIYPNTGYLTVRGSCIAKSKEEGAQILSPLKSKLLEVFRGCYLGTETEFDSLEEGVALLFKKKGLTLATAESCTGGGIASCLTKLPGVSSLFLGGIVCYSNYVKREVLGVKSDTLEQFGAVSKETVKEMLEGTLKVIGSDWAIAVSGIAGPDGGSIEKPVGTVIAGIQKKGSEPYIWVMNLKGNRKKNIENSINQVLGTLLLTVQRDER